MSELAPYSYFLRDVFPGASHELLRLLESSAENALLLRSDYLTIRDWLEIADCHTAEGLCALLVVLMLALEEGSLCVEASSEAPARRLADLADEPEARTWAERIVADLACAAGPRLVGTDAADHRPVIVHEVAGRRYLYFQKYLKAEQEF